MLVVEKEEAGCRRWSWGKSNSRILGCPGAWPWCHSREVHVGVPIVPGSVDGKCPLFSKDE